MKIADINVQYIDHMGSDISVVNAARVSFNKESEFEVNYVVKKFDDGESYSLQETKLSDKDAKLINYLARHNHWTPFAHAFISFRIKAPIFVARQLVKHQVGLAWNEVSRRYVDEEPEFWFPEAFRKRPEGSVKQGSSDEVFGVEWKQALIEHTKTMLAWYGEAINAGMAPEMARMSLPQNTMTEWIWSGSLAAFCRVCKLRLDSHAQKETQSVVEAIRAIAEPLFPVSFKVLVEAEEKA